MPPLVRSVSRVRAEGESSRDVFTPNPKGEIVDVLVPCRIISGFTVCAATRAAEDKKSVILAVRYLRQIALAGGWLSTVPHRYCCLAEELSRVYKLSIFMVILIISLSSGGTVLSRRREVEGGEASS